MNQIVIVAAWLLTLAVGLPAQNTPEQIPAALMDADHSDARVQTQLGFAYYSAEGVPKDFAKAAQWFRRAAEQGHPDAQRMLGYLYYGGDGVKQDHREAAKWFRLAAEQGIVNAQVVLGNMYYQGQGVEENHVIAHKWWYLAEETGSAEGKLYRETLTAGMTRDAIVESVRLAGEWKKKTWDELKSAVR